MKYRAIERWAGAGALAVALGACFGNQSGNLGATRMGDLSHPAERGSPVEALTSACGDGGMTLAGDAVIRRKPYLQQVAAGSATIGWVSTAPDGERVDVTAPDGRALATVGGEREAVTVRSAGESQLWARLTGLEPGTIYCYAIADDRGALSGRIGFRTAPAPDSAEPIGFMAFGDSGGGGSDQRALAEQMASYPYRFMIHTGDLAYDDGTIGQLEDNVFGIYAPLLEHLAFFPAPGNHEYHTLSAAPFRAVFALPGTSNERWYSYDWGRVHLAALDTESDYATQASWLDQDLAATALPWKIVYFHKPPYSSGAHGSDRALRGALAPVLEQHGVQLVLAGHDHDYERIAPQGGVQHVVTGGGGVGTRSVGTSSFTELAVDVIHFVYVEVGVDQLVLHAIDATGTEFDSVVVPVAP
jgi:calcineurin-like phosphoesterase family protein